MRPQSRADLADPLTFAPDPTVGFVVASLVLHHMPGLDGAVRGNLPHLSAPDAQRQRPRTHRPGPGLPGGHGSRPVLTSRPARVSETNSHRPGVTVVLVTRLA
jgi:hypothetical protein